MTILRSTLLVIISCCLIGSLSITNAAESNDTAKRQLFERFMLVTDVQARYAQIADIMVNQVKSAMQASIQHMIEKVEKATPEQKRKIGQIMEDAMARLAARMMVALKQEMPFSELVERVYYPIYDRHFSTSDLESILQFYESPTGKKFVSASPVILQESISLFNDLYSQKLQKLGQSIAEEELKRITPELERIGKD